MLKTTIKATPDQVQTVWPYLSGRQKDMVDFARTVGKNLHVYVLSTTSQNLLWDLEVER
jgi:hypothetical protein